MTPSSFSHVSRAYRMDSIMNSNCTGRKDTQEQVTRSHHIMVRMIQLVRHLSKVMESHMSSAGLLCTHRAKSHMWAMARMQVMSLSVELGGSHAHPPARGRESHCCRALTKLAALRHSQNFYNQQHVINVYLTLLTILLKHNFNDMNYH
jgi:hypothetical protein